MLCFPPEGRNLFAVGDPSAVRRRRRRRPPPPPSAAAAVRRGPLKGDKVFGLGSVKWR